MKRTKKLFVMATVAVLIISMFATGCTNQGGKSSDADDKSQDVIHVNIGTASVGGAWYPIAIGMAKIWNAADINVKAVAQATAGSPQNVQLLREKDVLTAIIRDEECRRAIVGEEGYKGNEAPWLRTLFPLPTTGSEIFALANKGIERIPDLKGRKVAVGPIGSGGELDAKDFLGMYGMTYDDIKPEFVEAAQAAEMMKDGLIDAAFLGLTGGSATARELMSTGKVKLLPLDEDVLDEYLADKPQFNKRFIEANFYPNQDYDVLTRGSSPDLLAVREDMPEELAYNLTKAIAENYKEFQEAHSMVDIWEPDVVTKVETFTELHPGAVKYWKEIGVLE